jgi:hypothetical protein
MAMTIHIPTWLAWVLGIGLGIPAAIAIGIFLLFAFATSGGRNPFQ